MKMTKTIKVGIILAALLVVSCLLFLFGKFPVMILNGEVCTIFTRNLVLDNVHDKEKPYDNADVETLNRMRFLTDLEMRNTEITDLSFLENKDAVHRIFYLGKSGYPIEDWNYLTKCENLTFFLGERVEMSDLSAFRGLSNLEELYIEYEYDIPLMVENLDVLVNDLSGLETLTNLQKCYIAGRDISDISEVRNCQKIVFLGLRGTTRDADYSVLLELPELDVLEIDSGVLPEDIKNELLEKGITVHEYDF